MSTLAVSATPPTAPRQLRLWPGLFLAIVQIALFTLPSIFFPGTMQQFMAMYFGPMIVGVLMLVWWVFASRLSWADRILLPLATVSLGVVSHFAVDKSLQFGLIIYSLPLITVSWAMWLVVTGTLTWPIRRAGLVAVIAMVWGFFSFLRVDGMDGSFAPEWAWRWSPTSEDRFLKDQPPRSAPPVLGAAPALKLTEGDWPAFRGPQRDGRYRGSSVSIDWAKNPPRQLWKHRIGPGWSSFTVVGKNLYTQEQRGTEEVVLCYDADTGLERWMHKDKTRFTEVVAGPGPRSTPTFHEGNLLTLGANGNLNCLDAATGQLRWTRDLVADTNAETPMWGFSSSPLVVDGLVIVFAGADNDQSLAAYDAATGEPRWTSGTGKYSYASPQLVTLGGVPQIVLPTDEGVHAYDPTQGTVLWKHEWQTDKLARITQPAVLEDGSLLIGTGMNTGTRRLEVARAGEQWKDREVYTTKAVNPYYNDFVIHKGHLYGFDGIFFTCVKVEDGKQAWRGGRYGNGQVLLLEEQNMLLVLSEKGDVVLVEATPEAHRERGRIKAITGKTWNHPVVAHGRLYVRNGEEMACYDLTP